jgi:osmotically-inducible protein OsmY
MTIMTDEKLERDVISELEWEPSLNAIDIGVSVEDGVVTLRGNVRSFAERFRAERVTGRVFGVTAVVNDLNVRLTTEYRRTDSEIAEAAVTALKWNTLVPPGRVMPLVANGWITLTGTVNWQYKKDAAARAVRYLPGVKGVINNIIVRTQVDATDVRDKIEAALGRSAERDTRRIEITVEDGKVTLSGNVHSTVEREEAERAAWAAPGVQEVDDQLAVSP